MKILALARILVGIVFFLFAQYKFAGPEFAHTGYAHYVGDYVKNGETLGFYRPFLEFTLRHPVVFGYAAAAVEMFIAVCLILGIWVRIASLVGAGFMLNFLFATWYGPGHGQPIWRYFGYSLQFWPLLLLFLVFFALRAGETWGLDARSRPARARPAKA